MNKSLLVIAVASAFGLFAATDASAKGAAPGGAEARIAAAEKKIASFSKQITDEKQRIVNRDVVDVMIKVAEALPVTNVSEGDAACKAFNAAGDKLKELQKSGLKRPVDGFGAQFNARIKAGKQKVVKSAKGLTCKQLDFIVDDSPVPAPQ